jgi:hypothetical protein
MSSRQRSRRASLNAWTGPADGLQLVCKFTLSSSTGCQQVQCSHDAQGGMDHVHIVKVHQSQTCCLLRKGPNLGLPITLR